MNRQAISLSRLNRAIAGYLSQPTLTNVWVVAELMDLRVNHGHCYMELVEKDSDSGNILARIRAAIWANNYNKISATFTAATGQRLAGGLKVMVCGTINYHPSFGISFIISDIDPTYSMGEAERRRREILTRLSNEGIINDNRSLKWSSTALRIAVVSAPGAAGYGDFINQLYSNTSRLKFSVKLFPAVMQGERTSSTVIAALDAIASEADDWDCVVIIRGGGASSDLQAFDDYALAANIAQFPLPVIVGIGHERDVTVLDYVANMRVKTPTAAAEWLISLGETTLERLRQVGEGIFRIATERIAASRMQLAQLSSTLEIAPARAFERARHRLQQDSITLAGVGARRIAPELSRLNLIMQAITQAGATAIARKQDFLTSKEQLLKALSPEATLSRGYSLTLLNGKAVRSAQDITEGDEVTTLLASGSFTSTVTLKNE